MNESFLDLVKARRDEYTSKPASDLITQGKWYPFLDDKLYGKMFSTGANVPTPDLYYCSSDVNDILNWNPPSGVEGFAIKAVGSHSSRGVYILADGFGGVELLNKVKMERTDVIAALTAIGAKKYIIEQYVGGENDALPDEYKIHVFADGEVGSIIYTTNRGSNCECFAELDTNWNRLDVNGCFRPSGQSAKEGQCGRIDFESGTLQTMKDLDLCGTTPDKPENLDAVIAVAKEISAQIGVYMRVDMMVDAKGEVMLGEYTPGHTNGRVHCSSKPDASGCIDSCFLGRMWSASSGADMLNGGTGVSTPAALSSVGTSSWDEQCSAYMTALGIGPA
mmetsp:Transcript_2371/g.5501  ORF Transcript_2371/g.5501 Transcript_2371/m.5501 type:complete len:335 (-) Transcript_2371:138-1142(-)